MLHDNGVKKLHETRRQQHSLYNASGRESKKQRISMVALRATARQVIRGVALVGAANVQAHSDRRAEKTAEAAKYDAFGPNHGGAFRPFDCGRTA